MDLTKGVLFSTVLHVFLLALAVVGLPQWFQTKIEEQPVFITLESLPITDKTNVKPSEQKVVKDKKALPKLNKPKPKPTPPKPSKPKPASPKPNPIAAPKEIEKTELKKPKPAPKKELPKKKTEPTLEEILKDIEKKAQSGTTEKKEKPKKDSSSRNSTQSAAPYNPTIPLSLSERDAVTSQFADCWNLLPGAANDYTLNVSVDVELRADGSVITVSLSPIAAQRKRYNSDVVFRAAADSVIRAVHLCSPLKRVPRKKYDSWKEMRLNFDPSMQLY